MSWLSEAFGRLVASLQRFAQTAALKTTFMGREVDYAQHDMRAPRDPQNMTVEDLWATQPHLRTVIDFRAGNIAQLGVQLFEADGEKRARVGGSEVLWILGRVDPYMCGCELSYVLVEYRLLYCKVL